MHNISYNPCIECIKKRGDIMRKRKHNSKLAPFAAGVAAGYGAALLAAALCAAALTLTDTASSGSGAAAILAVSVGSFVCGRISGRLRRKNGLQTGALSGIMFVVPLLVLSLIFGLAGSVLLVVKAALCLVFGMVGGVSGVNSDTA